jgi:hypothetical protein
LRGNPGNEDALNLQSHWGLESVCASCGRVQQVVNPAPPSSTRVRDVVVDGLSRSEKIGSGAALTALIAANVMDRIASDAKSLGSRLRVQMDDGTIVSFDVAVRSAVISGERISILKSSGETRIRKIYPGELMADE